jgi:hypothetical protein
LAAADSRALGENEAISPIMAAEIRALLPPTRRRAAFQATAERLTKIKCAPVVAFGREGRGKSDAKVDENR